MYPLVISKGFTFNKADGTYHHIEHTEKFNGTLDIFKESPTSELAWTKGGNNFPGGADPTKVLVDRVHPAIAAKLKQFDALTAGAKPAAAPALAPGEIAIAFNPTTRTARVL